jgi:hypothetical protein
MLIDVLVIRLDVDVQVRATMSEKLVNEYAKAMGADPPALFPPIVVFFDGTDYWLADGFHRVAAALKANVQQIEADVLQGGKREAMLFACGANEEHGLRRSRADRHRAVDRLLDDPEWSQWSDREIARTCKVDHRSVARWRQARQRSRSSLGNSPVTGRTYRTRHGTVSTMKVKKQRPAEPDNTDGANVPRQGFLFPELADTGQEPRRPRREPGQDRRSACRRAEVLAEQTKKLTSAKFATDCLRFRWGAVRWDSDRRQEHARRLRDLARLFGWWAEWLETGKED